MRRISKKRGVFYALVQLLRRVSEEDLYTFYVNFAYMINAGISIQKALDTISSKVENKKLKEAVNGVTKRVNAGESLSKSLTYYPRIFPKLFHRMVNSGEVSGKLPTILIKYVEFFQAQMDLRLTIEGILFYPFILLFISVSAIIFMSLYVIPPFRQVYYAMDMKLPLPTIIVFNSAIFIREFGLIVLVVIVFICIGSLMYRNTKRGQQVFDRLKLRIPVLGSLQHKVAIARFSRTLGTLLASEVPILEALDSTKEVLDNNILTEVVNDVYRVVEKGGNMSDALKISGQFPLDTIQMISAGEESGDLFDMLIKVADFYDIIVEHTVKKLTVILEPLFLFIMAMVVLLIMSAVLLPMFIHASLAILGG